MTAKRKEEIEHLRRELILVRENLDTAKRLLKKTHGGAVHLGKAIQALARPTTGQRYE
jgi:hypothetical protein